jgi:hypothetical protein
MKSIVTTSAFALVLATLTACGGGSALSDIERRYANACIATSGESYRALCECSSRIVAPKLTPGELTSMEKMTVAGQAWTEEKAKAAGFSLIDTGTFGQKKQDSFAEMSRSCGGQI